MPRSQNAHAYVNAAFLFKLSQTKVEKASICFGGIDPSFSHATETENFLQGKDLSDETTLQEIFKSLNNELKPDWVLPDASPAFRKCLSSGLLYKFILSIIPEDKIKEEYRSGGQKLIRNLSSGSQIFDVIEKNFPLTKPVMKLEALPQCSGEAKYTNDIQPMKGEVFCAFVCATVVGADIQEIDASEALKIPGVKAFFSTKDIPGSNTFTVKGMLGIVEEEEIFVSKTVKYYNQPLGVMVAESNAIASKASSKVRVMYTRTDHQVLPTMKEVLADKTAYPERIQNMSQCGEYSTITGNKEIHGIFDMGTQYHFTMEPQTTVCVPGEDGLTVYSATQWMDLVQSAISYMLKVQQNSIHVIVRRLGGAFGGKISRSSQIACACALVAHHLNRPTRFIQSIESMMGSLGKRYSNNSNYSVKVNEKGKILSLKNIFYEDCGWSLNENPINFHSTLMARNCYEQTASWKLEGNAVLTDAPSNTWCRSPGSTEGVAMMENIIDQIAVETGQDAVDVRMVNIASDNKMKELLPKFLKTSDYKKREADIKTFNVANRWRKKGISVSVMEFPIFYFGLYTATVAVYGKDGTVLISHGGIEMGQGMNTKVAQVAAFVLSIPLELVSVIQSDSLNGANSMVTGGGVGSESAAYAVKKCCETILLRLKPIKEELKNGTWVDIVRKASEKNINLMASDCHRPGDLNNYIVWGCSATEIEIDVLTGNVTVQRVDILEDTGESLSPLVDVGQIEGSFVMGLGYWLTEQCIFNKQTGMLLTDRTWNYKVPGIKDIPVDFRIELLQKSANNGGFLRSKATGEPAVCLSVGVVFAIRRAIESARKDAGIKEKWFQLSTPVTPEVIMTACSLKPTDMFKLG
ncbi:hypothetical protein ACFFRR_000120 [Megaselia abdita]